MPNRTPSKPMPSRQRFTPGRIEKHEADIYTAAIDDKHGGLDRCIWIGQIEVRGESRKEAARLRSLILKALEGQ